MLQERRRDLGPVALNYAEGPASGPPLVVLHGGSARWQYGEQLLRLLAPHWHVYAIDLRGHGRSGWVPGRYTLRDYAADIVAFLRAVVGSPAALYGHSLGGQVALLATALDAANVSALIVGDSPLTSDSDHLRDKNHRAMLHYWRDLATADLTPSAITAALRAMPFAPAGQPPQPAAALLGADNPWFDFMAGSLHDLDPTTLTAVLGDPAIALAGFEPTTLLPAIPRPVLLLQADPATGGLLTDAQVAAALPLLPHGQHRQLPGIGHSLHSTHPDAIRTAIEDFLTSALPTRKP